MTRASDYPELLNIAAILHQQRRLIAGQLRIIREEKALRDQMRALLDQVDIEQVECNGFLIARCQGRDGRSTVKVTPLRTRDAVENT
jgi:hypothetical protein